MLLNFKKPSVRGNIWNLNPSFFELLKYTALSFSVVLHGCKTWSLALSEENRLGVFENVTVFSGSGVSAVEPSI
jgi:hypothetical protein